MVSDNFTPVIMLPANSRLDLMAAYKAAADSHAILCNRPDEEVPPALARSIEAAARAAGLEFGPCATF